MADEYGPFDSGVGATWSEAQWYNHMPAAMPSGVIGSKQASATAGPLAWSASGLAVTLANGTANVGGSGFRRTGSSTSVNATSNGNATLYRRDRIVLRRDLGTHDVKPVIIQGTPSSSPTAPNITRSATVYDLKMFSFLVPPNNGTTLSSIIDERAWIDDTTTAVTGEPGMLDYAESASANLGNGGTAESIISAPSLTVSLVAGRLYRAVAAGCVNAVGASGSIVVNVRARLAGTPTASSPLVGTWQQWLDGAGGPFQVNFRAGGGGMDFQVASGGSYTFRVFGQVRSGNASSMQVTVDPRGVHSLAVYDLGAAPVSARTI